MGLSISGSEKLFLLQSGRKVGEQAVGSPLLVNEFVSSFSSSYVFVYFYPMNTMVRMLVNFSPRGCTLSVSPRSDVVGMETQVRVSWGGGVDDRDEVRYSLYLYGDAQ